MAKQRKHYSSEEKVSILRRRLVEGVAISTLCDELGLQPTVYYRWQKEFFENGAAAHARDHVQHGGAAQPGFGPRRASSQAGEQQRVAVLEQKLLRMNLYDTAGRPAAETKRLPGIPQLRRAYKFKRRSTWPRLLMSPFSKSDSAAARSVAELVAITILVAGVVVLCAVIPTAHACSVHAPCSAALSALINNLRL